MIWIAWILLLVDAQKNAGPPNLDRILIQADHAAFSALTDPQAKIKVNLRPLLDFKGPLSADQTLLAFRQLLASFEVRQARITQQQTDTNYTQLELLVSIELFQPERDFVFWADFRFELKLTAERMVLTAWQLQELH